MQVWYLKMITICFIASDANEITLKNTEFPSNKICGANLSLDIL